MLEQIFFAANLVVEACHYRSNQLPLVNEKGKVVHLCVTLRLGTKAFVDRRFDIYNKLNKPTAYLRDETGCLE